MKRRAPKKRERPSDEGRSVDPLTAKLALRTRLRDMTPQALEVLAAIMQDKNAKFSVRLRAIKKIWDIAHGPVPRARKPKPTPPKIVVTYAADD